MIIEKAIELSKLIKESDKLKKYISAKKALEENSELEHDLDYYLNLIDSLDTSEISFEKLEKDQQEEIEELEKMFSESDLVKDYLFREADLLQTLQMINSIINHGISR